jgi:hypothetical protein
MEQQVKLNRGPLHLIRTPNSDIKSWKAAYDEMFMLTWGRPMKRDFLC